MQGLLPASPDIVVYRNHLITHSISNVRTYAKSKLQKYFGLI